MRNVIVAKPSGELGSPKGTIFYSTSLIDSNWSFWVKIFVMRFISGKLLMLYSCYAHQWCIVLVRMCTHDLYPRRSRSGLYFCVIWMEWNIISVTYKILSGLRPQYKTHIADSMLSPPRTWTSNGHLSGANETRKGLNSKYLYKTSTDAHFAQ